MKLEHVHKNIRYTFSNENIEVNDKVYCLTSGRCLDNKDWILHSVDFEDFDPEEFDIMLDLAHSPEYLPYQARTNRGYSPLVRYYKIIKRELHTDITKPGHIFKTWDWIEMVD